MQGDNRQICRTEILIFHIYMKKYTIKQIYTSRYAIYFEENSILTWKVSFSILLLGKNSPKIFFYATYLYVLDVAWTNSPNKSTSSSNKLTASPNNATTN